MGREQNVCQGPTGAGTRQLSGPTAMQSTAYLRPHLMGRGHWWDSEQGNVVAEVSSLNGLEEGGNEKHSNKRLL